jgi:hypothetical protein
MPNLETQDLVRGVRFLSDQKRKARRVCWAVVWSDELRPWFSSESIVTGWSGRNHGYWEIADEAACSAKPPLLHKWQRDRDPPLGAITKENGWSLPEYYEEAAARAEAQGFEQIR